MASLWISVAFLTLIQNAASLYDSSVCNILEESYGLIPPPLPKNFELKAERVEHLDKFAAYEEVYFDYTNSRAKYRLLLDTVEYNYLFDYDAQQIVQWIKVHPGTSMKRDPLSYSCEAVNMDESDLTSMFGDEDTLNLRPKMFNSNQALRYGGQYLYAANGTTKLYDRDIQANKFVGCIYDASWNATLKNTFYFADTNIVQPSGGTPSSVVTGSDEKPLSVPVKVHMEGRSYKGAESIPLNRTISISWFKGEPQFEMDTFQIPPWIHCNNYRKSKAKPKFPRAFSTRLAVTSFSVDILGQLQPGDSYESYQEIYYDSNRLLARKDFTPMKDRDGDIYGKFGSYTPVSTIYDFNEGLRYTINKPSGRCYIYPIMENEFFDTEEDLLYRKLATPEEIFLMQMDDMQYKGKAFARDIMCDVWNGQHKHKTLNATIVKETYFSTDGWHEIADEMLEFRVPVRHVTIASRLDGDLTRHIQAFDFLKFKGNAPKMAAFNIQNCVELIDHKRFAIELALNADSSPQIFKYKFLFLEAAQLYIANKTEVNTPLRVQRLHLRHLSASSNRVFLAFSLLDKANLKDLPIVVGQKGKDLQEAIYLLQKLVDDGKFAVQFKNPINNKENILSRIAFDRKHEKFIKMITVLAERGSLYSLTADGGLTRAPLMQGRSQEQEKVEAVVRKEEIIHREWIEPYGMELREEEKVTEETILEEHNGMKNGNLAFLAFAMLFIGVGIGIAVMYLYIRVYSDRLVEDKIKLTPQAGPSTSAGISEEGPV